MSVDVRKQPHPACLQAVVAHTTSIHCHIKHRVDNVIDLELHCLCTAPLTKGKIMCLGCIMHCHCVFFP